MATLQFPVGISQCILSMGIAHLEPEWNFSITSGKVLLNLTWNQVNTGKLAPGPPPGMAPVQHPLKPSYLSSPVYRNNTARNMPPRFNKFSSRSERDVQWRENPSTNKILSNKTSQNSDDKRKSDVDITNSTMECVGNSCSIPLQEVENVCTVLTSSADPCIPEISPTINKLLENNLHETDDDLVNTDIEDDCTADDHVSSIVTADVLSSNFSSEFDNDSEDQEDVDCLNSEYISIVSENMATPSVLSDNDDESVNNSDQTKEVISVNNEISDLDASSPNSDKKFGPNITNSVPDESKVCETTDAPSEITLYKLCENEEKTSLDKWKAHTIMFFKQFPDITPFIEGQLEWNVYSSRPKNSCRGVSETQVYALNAMLAQMAGNCPDILHDRIFRWSTSIDEVWSNIYANYGVDTQLSNAN